MIVVDTCNSTHAMRESFTEKVVEALVPKEQPSNSLGPSREFVEKHNLIFINNLMGLSCLFFVTAPLTIVGEYSTLIEQSFETISVLASFFVVFMVQTFLSVSGDYWFTRRSPETDRFVLDRAIRWILGKHESVVVTGPGYIETWKCLYIATTLDVFMAMTLFVLVVSMGFWQLCHGSQLLYCLAATIIAVVCKKAGEFCLKGYSDDTYDPKKVWWFNFFHFNWHFFGNIGLYLFTTDLCRNGLRGF